MENEFARGHLVRIDDGCFVERDVLSVIQKIQDYDPNLKVQYLEYAANLNEAPWRIIELCKDGKWRLVFYCWSLDQRVLERLYAADTHKLDVLGKLDKNNNNIRNETQKRYREEMDQALDITKHMVKSPKGRWSFTDRGQKVTVDDDPLRRHKVEEL
jgi:hypothetical protein